MQNIKYKKIAIMVLCISFTLASYAQVPVIEKVQDVDITIPEKQITDTIKSTDTLQPCDTLQKKSSDSSSMPLNPQIVNNDTSNTSQDTSSESTTEINAVVIEGILIDKENGGVPVDDSLFIQLDSINGKINSSGEFSFITSHRQYYMISVFSKKYGQVRKSIPYTEGKSNYFLTITLDKNVESGQIFANQIVDTAVVPWTIAGTIIDSRFDLVIESDSAVMLFDKDTVLVTHNGNFLINTHFSGLHTLYVSIPGYHQVTQSIVLEEKLKQHFITIPTTILSKVITRREITVSANALPVHRSASVAKIEISRKELQRTSATMNDPLRVLQTLPGVASESDASARPIVRGGDVLESRVFLDGLTLIQPYHFGGARSTFNQQSIKQLTLYKSGFPSELHNAQSAIIEAESRIPSDEKTSFEADVNYLQYSAYLGIPLFKGKAGLNFSSQGSYANAISQLVLKAGAAAGNEQMKLVSKQINIPDYQDFTVGMSLAPTPQFKVFINEIFNTDRAKFTNGDSAIDVTYNYYKYDLNGNRLLDTSVVMQEYFSGYAYPSYGYQQPIPNRTHDGHPVIGKPYYDVDTIVNYKSNYNILMGKAQYILSDHNMFNLTLGWQKRWWDLDFPAMTEIFRNSIYDITIDQYNGNFGWIYSAIQNHVLKTGIQLDYSVADYNVYMVRFIHEMIANGSTNFIDFWGPINGDSAMILNAEEDYLRHLSDRILVSYKGKQHYYDAGYYLSDSWDLLPNLHCDMGMRLEYSSSDHEKSFSPRASLRFNPTEKNELMASIGHYTQNNYSISAIALSEDLKPEKVWHGGLGIESKLLPWLTQKIDLYGKYYYDLLSEIITPIGSMGMENVLLFISRNYAQSYIDTLSDKNMELLIASVISKNSIYRSKYLNKGKGYSYGFEYMLRFEPTDFWHGWFSFSWGQSVRQRKPGWREHPFPLDRPLLISINNYYRLPRKYEIGLKYRYMSGIPYTSVKSNNDRVTIGAFNDKRYAPYQRLDLRFSKGFSIKGAKGHFYTEIWNAMNAPNLFALDSKTKALQTYNSNLPTTTLYIGFDCIY